MRDANDGWLTILAINWKRPPTEVVGTESFAMKFRLSIAQMDLMIGAEDENFQKVSSLTEQAAQAGSRLIVLPELWSTAYDLENWRRHAHRQGTGMFERLSHLSVRHRIAIAGSILETDGDRAFNTLVVYEADGRAVGSYRKVHLVPMLDEPRWLAPGDHLSLIEPSWGATGLGICYDLRFPEMWRKYAVAGAKLMLIPAEWPSRRAQHWSALLRARAIENQVFVVACNRVGETKGEQFAGLSAVLDPWGNTVVEGDREREELYTVDIELDQVDEIRSTIPVFASRRPDLY